MYTLISVKYKVKYLPEIVVLLIIMIYVILIYKI